jgi:hypothetical protein
MISTPATLALETLLPRQGGRTPQAVDAAAMPDFADLINRLVASNFSVAALPPATDIQGAAPAPPDRDRIEPEQREETADRPEENAQETAPDEPGEVFQAADGRASHLPPAPPETPAPVAAPSTEPNAAPAPRLPLQAPQQSAPVTAAPQNGERPIIQGQQPLLQANDADALPQPQQPQQPQGQQQAATGTSLRAQAVPGDGPDQLPQFGHTLSGRTAVVAQTESGGAALPKEGGPAAKAGPAEQNAAALLGNTLQTSPIAAQRAKGQAKPGNAGGNGQNAQGANAQGAQATQAAGQAAPQATAATPPQNGFNNALAAAANGSGQAATAPQGVRIEPFAPVGGSQPAPYSNFRGVEQTAAPKPRIPVPPRFVANQVAVQIQKSIGQGNDRISIQLRPAELGKVDVRLDVGSDGRVSAVITADRADTLDLLQRDARILQNSLQDAGLRADSNSLSFELKGNGQSYAEAHHDTSGKGDSDPAGANGTALPDAGPAARPGIVTNDRVDIHV